MKILGIDTSSTIFSICLVEEEKILYELRCERSFYKNSKDAGFFSNLKYLLEAMNNPQIDAIAITIGPGMFTSLRVGLAFAKGLYLSRNIPIYTVNTLELIAVSFPGIILKNKIDGRIIIAPVINAFQNEIYVAFYKRHKRIGQDLLITPDFLIKYINNKFKQKDTIIILGPGVQILKQHSTFAKFIKKSEQIILLDAELFFPSAAKAITTALPRIRKKEYDSPELLEPYYIKKTSAEAGVRK